MFRDGILNGKWARKDVSKRGKTGKRDLVSKDGKTDGKRAAFRPFFPSTSRFSSDQCQFLLKEVYQRFYVLPTVRLFYDMAAFRPGLRLSHVSSRRMSDVEHESGTHMHIRKIYFSFTSKLNSYVNEGR
jgi:hypothetical protein